MAYQALYRQWRPQCFEEIVGQAHVTQTLCHAIDGNRLAHAYLFSGPRGVGKTSTARILAKAVNCQEGPTSQPCDQCRHCRSIANNSALDVIEIDAASNNGVDEIRELREKVKYAPAECRYKVYIIDEVHMLSMAAFNALLKTLEEPPEHVIFILATTEVHKLPATIVSRCQRFEFHRILVPTIEKHLQTMVEQLKITLEPEARRLIARAADGGMRDAISILDQCTAYAPEKIRLSDVTDLLGTLNDEAFFLLTQHIQEGKVADCLTVIQQAYQQGKNLNQFLKDYLFYLRGLLQILAGTDDVSIVLADMSTVKQQAQHMGKEAILSLIHVLVKAENEMRYASNKQLVLEMAVIESQYYLQGELVQLSVRLSKLEKLVQQGRGLSAELEAKPLATSKQHGEHEVKPIHDVKVASKTQPHLTQTNLKPLNEKRIVVADEKKTLPKMPLELPINGASDASDQAPVTAVLRLTAIQRQWPTILQHVKGRDVITHALMHKASPIELKGNELIIQFENDFHRNQITSEAKSKILLDVLEKMYGQRLKITGVVNNTQPKQDQVTQSKTDSSKDDMVQKALEIFGGTIVNEEGKHV